MFTLSQVIILLVFIGFGSAGIAAMQDGITVIFRHLTKASPGKLETTLRKASTNIQSQQRILLS